MKHKQSILGYLVVTCAALLAAFKGTLDWMGIAVIGGIMIPSVRKWLGSLFGRDK